MSFSGSVDAESQKYGDYQQRMDVARSHFEELQTSLDSRFQTWMCNSFSSLHNLPAVQPVMVHHIPRYLPRILGKSDDKLFLIVLDGMACDQWLVIKDELSKCKSNITFQGVQCVCLGSYADSSFKKNDICRKVTYVF